MRKKNGRYRRKLVLSGSCFRLLHGGKCAEYSRRKDLKSFCGGGRFNEMGNRDWLTQTTGLGIINSIIIAYSLRYRVISGAGLEHGYHINLPVGWRGDSATVENPTVVYPRKAIGLINTGKALFDRSGTGLAKELAKGELKLKVSFTMYGELAARVEDEERKLTESAVGSSFLVSFPTVCAASHALAEGFYLSFLGPGVTSK
ncbi:hypothetical protein K0M31_014056 [Melipona bicolor]|uniref:Uncharacterized protein n=1 Tax=Melipona bicolor TaxID=60889 RepID=A0AA40G802_9HYME|nr:hypothetical protein K0M31_014056 [Melipona bicolor]